MNRYDFTNRAAVVTGGAQGIGYAVAQRLFEGGARVALWDRDEGALSEARARLGDVQTVLVDLTDRDAVIEATSRTQERFGQIDVLVHSAGIAGANATVADYAPEEWSRVIDVDLNAAFHVNQAIVRTMIARGYGRIVNIASIAGKEGNPNASHYSASKAGLIGLTKSLGKELAGKNILVNAVTPAAAKTEIFDSMSQEHIDYMLSKIPMNRFLMPEEAASLILWLSSADCAFSTGAVFDLSGGRATY
jgi:3-oxoacyl-[acyl-carrier protein] reductase